MKAHIHFLVGLWTLIFCVGCEPNPNPGSDNNTGTDSSSTTNTGNNPSSIGAAVIFDSAYIELPFSPGVEKVYFRVVGNEAVMEDDISLGSVERVKIASERLEKKIRNKPEVYKYIFDSKAPRPRVSDYRSNIANSAFKGKAWKDGIVPIDFHSNIESARSTIESFLTDISSVCGVTFPQRTNEVAFVQFKRDDSILGAGLSRVGQTGFMQLIKFDSGSPNSRTVVHEMLHALGFYHEQSRPDRDDYLDMHWECIPEEWVNNYAIKDLEKVTMTGPYDLASIMHYPSASHSDDPSCVNFVDKSDSLIYVNSSLSPEDIAGLNALYPRADIGQGVTCSTSGRPCRIYSGTGSVGAGLGTHPANPYKIETGPIRDGNCLRVKVTKKGGKGAGKIWVRRNTASNGSMGPPDYIFPKETPDGASMDFLLRETHGARVIVKIGCPTAAKKFDYEVCMTHQ